jgi:hypothetical protein
MAGRQVHRKQITIEKVLGGFVSWLVHIILSLPCGDKNGQNLFVKNWELVADKLSKSGWSLGWVSAVDSKGRTIWIVDAHRDNGKRFIVRSDQKLAAFLELERITHELAVSALLGDRTH